MVVPGCFYEMDKLVGGLHLYEVWIPVLYKGLPGRYFKIVDIRRLFSDGKMTEFTTIAISPTSGENSHFFVSKQTVKVHLSLDVLGKIKSFSRREQAIANSCRYSTCLRLMLRTSHSLAIARFPH